MPYLAHAKITYSGVFGTLADPVEIWSWSCNLVDGPEGSVGLQAGADYAKQAWMDFIAPIQPSSVVLTRTRLSLHQAGLGRVQQDAEGGYLQADNLEATTGLQTLSNRLPLQTAMCVSLRTGRSGPRGRGRFFLPAPNFVIQPDFRINQPDQELVADGVDDWIQALQNFDGGSLPESFSPIVASSFGFNSVVNEIRVGRVLDTMRSRRGELDEAYIARNTFAS